MDKGNSMYSAFNTEKSSIVEQVLSRDSECKLKTALNNYSNSGLEKIAYMHIDNPTIERVEDFVRDYMLNELSFFPNQLNVNVSIIPSKFNKDRPELILDATGIASVNVGGRDLEFPFMISDGEMLPLDVIQMDGQRVPFSRGNMIRIVNSLDKLSKKNHSQSGQVDDSPFVGLAGKTSPAVISGFLGDVLAIRDMNTTSRVRSGGHWITAAGYDYGLEKLAKISGEDTLIGMFYKGKTRKDLEKDSKKETEKAKEEEKKATENLTLAEKVASRLSPARGKVASIQYADDMPLSEKIANYNALSQMNKVNQNHNNYFGSYAADGEEKSDNEFSLKNKIQNYLSGLKNKDNKKDIGEEKESMDPLAQMNKVNANHNNYFGVTASEIHTDLDAILEKVANLAPLSDKQLDAMLYVLQKKAHDETVSYFEKFASPVEGEIQDRQKAEQMENYYNLKWKDANHIPHGTFIIFPEIKDDEISVTPGLVIDKFFNFKNGKYQKYKCVISQDRRLKILENRSPFMCMEAPNKSFKLKTAPISSLGVDEYFIAFHGDEVIPPSRVTNIQNITGPANYSSSEAVNKTSDNDMSGKLLTFKILTEDTMSPYLNQLKDPMIKDQYKAGRYQVWTLIGKKFDYLKPTEFISSKARETQTSENVVSAVYNSYGFSWSKPDEILSTDENTPVVKIAGPITTHIESQKQFENLMNLRDVGYNLGEMQEKAAFQLNTVNIQCTDRHAGTFNVHVDYKDTTQRLMNFRSQDFNGVNEGKLRAILRVCKFTGPKIGEIVYKAKNEPYANYPLPPECKIDDINKLAGGAITNVSKESLKKAVNKFVNPVEIGKALAAGAVADLAVNSMKEIATNPTFQNLGGKAFNLISKLSSDAKELSGEFEKYAAIHEDYELLDIAKTFAISANFMDKVATVLEDKENVWPSIHEAAEEIVAAKPVLEKFAYDLTGLKISEHQKGMENFNFSTLSNAVRHLDDFYKVACTVYFSTNPDELNLKG